MTCLKSQGLEGDSSIGTLMPEWISFPSLATKRAPGLEDPRSPRDSFYCLHALNYLRKSHTKNPRTMGDSHLANTPSLARRGKEICGHCSPSLWLLI